MKLALQDCKGELRLYAPLVKRPDLPGQMLKAMSELKHAAISLEMLEEAAKKAEGFLKDKLSDLALLRRTYEALLGAHYTDEEDDLSRAEEQIRAHRWFAGKKVWLDGFKSFTAAQERILFLMLEQGADVTAALSLSEGDPRNRPPSGFGHWPIKQASPPPPPSASPKRRAFPTRPYSGL